MSKCKYTGLDNPFLGSNVIKNVLTPTPFEQKNEEFVHPWVKSISKVLSEGDAKSTTGWNDILTKSRVKVVKKVILPGKAVAAFNMVKEDTAFVIDDEVVDETAEKGEEMMSDDDDDDESDDSSSECMSKRLLPSSPTKKTTSPKSSSPPPPGKTDSPTPSSSSTEKASSSKLKPTHNHKSVTDTSTEKASSSSSDKHDRKSVDEDTTTEKPSSSSSSSSSSKPKSIYHTLKGMIHASAMDEVNNKGKELEVGKRKMKKPKTATKVHYSSDAAVSSDESEEAANQLERVVFYS